MCISTQVAGRSKHMQSCVNVCLRVCIAVGVMVLGTVKGVREADNKPRTDPGTCNAAGLALEWPPRRQAGLCLLWGPEVGAGRKMASHINSSNRRHGE